MRNSLALLDDVKFGSFVDDLFKGVDHFYNDNPIGNSSNVRYRELDKEYQIHIDLPGVTKDGIDINVDKGSLSIKSERNFDNKVISRFEKKFRLNPELYKVDSVDAEYENGVLILKIQKRESSIPKRIEVK